MVVGVLAVTDLHCMSSRKPTCCAQAVQEDMHHKRKSQWCTGQLNLGFFFQDHSKERTHADWTEPHFLLLKSI